MINQELTPTEKKIFNSLVEAKGDVVSYIKLQEAIYPGEYRPNVERNRLVIRTYIGYIRKKIPTGAIGTVRGEGFFIEDLRFTHRYRVIETPALYCLVDGKNGLLDSVLLSKHYSRGEADLMADAMNLYNLRRLYGADRGDSNEK